MRSLPTVKKRATCTTQAHDQPQCNQLMTPNKELAVTIEFITYLCIHRNARRPLITIGSILHSLLAWEPKYMHRGRNNFKGSPAG